MSRNPTRSGRNRPRSSASLTPDAELLRQAQVLELPQSHDFEAESAVEAVEARRQQWLDANRAAIDAIEARVERDGLCSDGRRLF